MKRLLVLFISFSVVTVACGGGYTQDEVDGLVESAVSSALNEAEEPTSTSLADRETTTPTEATTIAVTGTGPTTTAVALGDSDPRSAFALEGNAAPPLATGTLGEVSIIANGYFAPTYGGTVIMVVVRNNTGGRVKGVEVVVTARDAAGLLAATGSSDSSSPYRLDQGEIAFASIYLADVEDPEGAQLAFQVSVSPADEGADPTIDLEIAEHNLIGNTLLAVVANPWEQSVFLVRTDVMCFDEAGVPTGYINNFTDLDSIPGSGGTSPVSVDLGSNLYCPTYLIAANGFLQ